MKLPLLRLSLLAVSTFATVPLALRAQDAPPPADYSAPPPDGGDQGESFQNFYDQLGSQGQWIQTDNYGYVFQPTVQDPNWAPYSDGHWVYTDMGWTWVSDEPWGWATYHYGRWANIDGTGWVWVPGYTWAPAWVSWRHGGGYSGWAPLPPSTLIGIDFAGDGIDIGIGFHFGSDCDEQYGIGPGCYNFVRDGDFGERNYRNYYVDRSRNYTVINNTTNITNVTYNNGQPALHAVRAGGPNFSEINRSARTPVQQVSLVQGGRPGGNTLSGNTLNVYAPRINPATVHQARPASVARTLAHVQVNRGTSISHPLQATAQFKPAAPSADAIAAAKRAQAAAPRSAHIATAKTVPKYTIRQPLMQMKPAAEVRHTAAQPNAGGERPAASEIGQPNRPAAEMQQPRPTESTSANTQAEEKARAATEERERTQQATEARTSAQEQARAATESRTQEQAQERTQAQAQEQSRAATEERARTQEESRAATQEHTRAPEVTHAEAPAPRPQERAPAPVQHSAPAGGGGGGGKGPEDGKDKNNH